MAGQSFRFLHASHFCLASPLSGIVDVPDDLRDLLVHAPREACERVFEVALREEVDFVVLSGDILEPAGAGPAIVAFLLQKLESLRAQNIAVYWAGSKMDMDDDLLFSLELPGNVHLFPSDRVERVPFCRGEIPVVSLSGRSWNSQRPLRGAEFARDGQEEFQLAVLYGAGDLDTNLPGGIDYWALGGSHEVANPRTTQYRVAHGPGSPQGMCPWDAGAHGCTLVSVDGEGEIRMRRMETDTVRWQNESLEFAEGTANRDIRQTMRSRLENRNAAPDRPRLITWTLTGPGRFDSPLAARGMREELLDWSRKEFGHRTPPVWSLAVDIEPPEEITGAWCDDDSILGDYLRIVHDRMDAETEPIDLRGMLPQRQLPDALREALSVLDADETKAALRGAAVQGADLLRGDDSAARPSSPYSSPAEPEGVPT
ncbi:MAG: exonuclease SbcCD subunit D [Pirellulaceae bacterium]